MSDIVERLMVQLVTHHQVSRDDEEYETVARVHPIEAIKLEAAGEITQLRAALAESCDEHRSNIYESGPGGGCVLLADAIAAERERCAAEIERLRDALAARSPLNFDQLQSVMAAHFGSQELTDDEVDSAEDFARAVERAHGIVATPSATAPQEQR